jgi:hypothetical protein
VPGAISLRRELDRDGESVFIDIGGDNGTAWLVLSAESAGKLGEALMSLSRNPQGDQN